MCRSLSLQQNWKSLDEKRWSWKKVSYRLLRATRPNLFTLLWRTSASSLSLKRWHSGWEETLTGPRVRARPSPWRYEYCLEIVLFDSPLSFRSNSRKIEMCFTRFWIDRENDLRGCFQNDYLKNNTYSSFRPSQPHSVDKCSCSIATRELIYSHSIGQFLLIVSMFCRNTTRARFDMPSLTQLFN